MRVPLLKRWLLLGAPLVLLLASPLLSAVAAGDASASPLTGSISGPQLLGESGRGSYTVTGQGGPGEAPNGSLVGVYSYKATVGGSNTTGVIFSPPQGVLVNGSTKLQLNTNNVSQTLTLSVEITSSYGGKNETTNISTTVDVIAPYHLAAVLVVPPNGVTVAPFNLTVSLDGTPVGHVTVATMSSGSKTPIGFDYVNRGLTPGWHTFSMNLEQEHGLVVFSGGSEYFTTSFYVSAPPPNYGFYYFAGAAAFVGAIFIWATLVRGRRRGRSRK